MNRVKRVINPTENRDPRTENMYSVNADRVRGLIEIILKMGLLNRM